MERFQLIQLSTTSPSLPEAENQVFCIQSFAQRRCSSVFILSATYKGVNQFIFWFSTQLVSKLQKNSVSTSFFEESQAHCSRQRLR